MRQITIAHPKCERGAYLKDEITKMNCNNANARKRPLGALKVATKTKPRSPDMTGRLTLHSHTLEELVRQYKDNGQEEVPCNIAAWKNRGKDGVRILTVESSPWFVSKRKRRSDAEADIFADLFGHDE